MFTLFLTWPTAPAIELSWLAGIAGLARAHVYTPAVAHDPYLDDGPPPACALQLYFAEIAALEAACAADGALATRLPDREVTQQAMLARPILAAEPMPDPACTYLVAYTGEAEDLNAWHAHYMTHHAPIMCRFPAIRAIEICTRLDWISALPFRQVDYMQRNKNVFDSAADLDAAINSPVRHEMRADFHTFPPYTGAVLHYPMLTHTIEPHRSPR